MVLSSSHLGKEPSNLLRLHHHCIPGLCKAGETLYVSVEHKHGLMGVRVAAQDDERLLKLYESGLPAWAIYMPLYRLPYRPWMRTVSYCLFVAISIFSMAMGFYDLIKNVPYLHKVSTIPLHATLPNYRADRTLNEDEFFPCTLQYRKEVHLLPIGKKAHSLSINARAAVRCCASLFFIAGVEQRGQQSEAPVLSHLCVAGQPRASAAVHPLRLPIWQESALCAAATLAGPCLGASARRPGAICDLARVSFSRPCYIPPHLFTSPPLS